MAETKPASQCVVNAADFEIHWQGKTSVASGGMTLQIYPARYSGPERRANAHDRRFYNGQGGRRLLDRKS